MAFIGGFVVGGFFGIVLMCVIMYERSDDE